MGTRENQETRRLRQVADDLRRKAAETQLASYQEQMRKAADELEARAREIELSAGSSASRKTS